MPTTEICKLIENNKLSKIPKILPHCLHGIPRREIVTSKNVVNSMVILSFESLSVTTLFEKGLNLNNYPKAFCLQTVLKALPHPAGKIKGN